MKLGELLDVEMLRASMKDRFIVRRNHPHLPLAILNYTNECMFKDFWPPEVQHCRGLIIGAVHDHDVCDDCEIIARPFHKFFNLNYTTQPDYYESNLPKVEPTVTEKMDGWFGILWRYQTNDDAPLSMVPNWDPTSKCYYGVASRGSFESPGANFATSKLGKLIKYGAIEEFPKGYSPIFEIISKECKVVVDYPFEGLVLLGCVNNETGEELPYDQLQAVWAKIAGYSADNRPWIRLVKAHSMSVDDCLTSDKKNFEGFVLSYPRPGTWPIKVKVKLDEYKRLHKLITGVTPQQIWGTLHDPLAPWLGSGVPDHFRKWAIQWRDKLYGEFHKTLRRVEGLLDALPVQLVSTMTAEEQRKDYFHMLENRSPDLASIAMYLYDGKIYEAHQAIWNRIRPIGREDTLYREGKGE